MHDLWCLISICETNGMVVMKAESHIWKGSTSALNVAMLCMGDAIIEKNDMSWLICRP